MLESGNGMLVVGRLMRLLRRFLRVIILLLFLINDVYKEGLE